MGRKAFNRFTFFKNQYKKFALPLIRLLDKCCSRLSARLAYHYWRRTFRHPPSSSEKRLQAEAGRTRLSYYRHQLPVYLWGKTGPLVLIMGGWNGRASQFGELIPALQNAGFRVIGIDPPGHGNAGGKTSSILNIADTIRTLTEKYTDIEHFIGHSAGAVAGIIAQHEHQCFKSLCLISMPNDSRWLLDSYCQQLRIRQKTAEHIKQLFLQRHGDDAFERTSAVHFIEEIEAPALLIHDQKDRLVPLSQSEELSKRNPRLNLHITRHLGHFRIISAAQTSEKICDFLIKNKH